MSARYFDDQKFGFILIVYVAVGATVVSCLMTISIALRASPNTATAVVLVSALMVAEIAKVALPHRAYRLHRRGEDRAARTVTRIWAAPMAVCCLASIAFVCMPPSVDDLLSRKEEALSSMTQVLNRNELDYGVYLSDSRRVAELKTEIAELRANPRSAFLGGITAAAVGFAALAVVLEALSAAGLLLASWSATSADERIFPVTPPPPPVEAMLQIVAEPAAEQHIDNEDVSVSLDAIAAEHIDWECPQIIARKRLHLIGGDPGTGKSQLCAFFAARVTAGGLWPCGLGEAQAGGGVLWWSSEEDPSEDIKPRLLAAGADVRRVRLLRPGFQISGGVDELEREALRLGGARLLILDPINACLGDKARSNDGVRATLMQLGNWARRRNLAVIGVLHPPKGKAATPSNLFGSFRAWREVARATWFVSKDDADSGRSLMTLDKGNIIRDKRGYAYRMETVRVASGVEAPRIVWEPKRLDEHELAELEEDFGRDEAESVNDRLTVRGPRQERKSPKGDVMEWLRDALADGPRYGPDLKTEARENGFLSMDTFNEAAKTLGVVKTPSGQKGGAMFWSLPEKGE